MQRDVYQNALQERVLCELSQWTSEWDWREAKVLDVGSRYGHRSEQLAQQLAPLRIDGIRGVDTDVHGIEFATKHLADEKLEFSYIADLEDRFPLKYSQGFDWVLHINPTLFHLNNQEAALRNLLWCLKPSTGRLLLAIPCRLPANIAATTAKVILKKMGKQLNQWMAEALDVNKKPWYDHPQADRIYAHIMESVGFRVHRTKIMDFKYKFEKKTEYKASLESYYFDVIMSFPEEQREALAKRLHSTAGGSGLRSTSRWDASYVLILASRPALRCSVCYGPRRTQQDRASDERQATDNRGNSDVPPPVPLVGPPPDVEGDVGELQVDVVHNDDLDDADESDEEEHGANDDEGVAQNIKGNLFVDDINHYDRVPNYDEVGNFDDANAEDDYIESGVINETKKDNLTTDQPSDRLAEEGVNNKNLNGTAEVEVAAPTNLIDSEDVNKVPTTEEQSKGDQSLNEGVENELKQPDDEGQRSENKEDKQLEESQRPSETITKTENITTDVEADQGGDEAKSTPKDIPVEESTAVEVKSLPASTVRRRRPVEGRQNETAASQTSTVGSRDFSKGLYGDRGLRRRRQDL